MRVIMHFDNWPLLFLGRLMYRKAGLFVYCKNGLEILIDHRGGDECGTRGCIVNDMYRKYVPLFRFQNDVRLLDIGANGGGFPLMLMLEGLKLAQVVCVEMNPLTCLRLQLNLQTNLGFSAVAINAAVCGDPEREIHLAPSRGGTSYSIDKNLADASSPGVDVKATTLQALYDRYFSGELIDICKVDIEGAEYDVFSSSDDDLLRKIRYLIVEFHDAPRTPAVIKRLLNLGFSEITDHPHPEDNAGARTEVRCFRGADAEDSSFRTRSQALSSI